MARFNKDLNIDMKLMRNYLEVVDCGSFTRASKKLRVGQATISHQIQMLEDSLGVTLIIRSSREFSLTDEGVLFGEFCQSTLREFDALKEQINRAVSGGSCTIAASSIPAVYILPEVIAMLTRANPGFLYRSVTGDTRDSIELLKEGKADIAIVGREISHPQLVFIEIVSDRLILAGGRESPDSLSLKELRDIPFVGRENGSGTRAAFEAALSKAGLQHSDLNIVYECSNSESLKRAVAAGIGAGYISSLAVKDEISAGTIKEMKVRGLKIERNFYMVKKINRPLTPPAAYLEESLLRLS